MLPDFKGNCNIGFGEKCEHSIYRFKKVLSLRQQGLVLLRVYLCGLLPAALRLKVHLSAFQPKCNFPNSLLYRKDCTGWPKLTFAAAVAIMYLIVKN